jgi:hypothetical protein
MSESTANLQFSFKAISEHGFEHIVVWRDDRGETEGGPETIARIVAAMKATEKALLAAGYKAPGHYIPSPPSKPRSNGSSSKAKSQGQASISGFDTHEGVAQGTVTVMQADDYNGKFRLGVSVQGRSKPVYMLAPYDKVNEFILPKFQEGVFTDDFTFEDLQDQDRVYKPKHFGKLTAVTGKGKERGFWDVLQVSRG